MASVKPQGSEKRNSILPSSTSSGIGMLGSSYSPADAMKTPNQIGVKVGNSMDDVINAVKGVGFYTDQIGFGSPSTGLTNGMPLKPLGVNYFMKTGMTCSNGAKMWQYIQGIPDGSALGKNVKNAMSAMGLPALQGLAPGMLEDVKHALDPGPMMNALFGSGYPECIQVTLPVGDAYGRIRDDTTGEPWIADPDTAIRSGDGYVQKRWIQNKDSDGNPVNLSREEYNAAKKNFNPDGTPKNSDAFVNMLTQPATIVVVGVLCLLAFGMMKKRR
jgi:hypothetical protein